MVGLSHLHNLSVVLLRARGIDSQVQDCRQGTETRFMIHRHFRLQARHELYETSSGCLVKDYINGLTRHLQHFRITKSIFDVLKYKETFYSTSIILIFDIRCNFLLIHLQYMLQFLCNIRKCGVPFDLRSQVPLTSVRLWLTS